MQPDIIITTQNDYKMRKLKILPGMSVGYKTSVIA